MAIFLLSLIAVLAGASLLLPVRFLRIAGRQARQDAIRIGALTSLLQERADALRPVYDAVAPITWRQSQAHMPVAVVVTKGTPIQIGTLELGGLWAAAEVYADLWPAVHPGCHPVPHVNILPDAEED